MRIVVFVVMIEVMHQKDATEQNRLNRKIPDKMFPEERDQQRKLVKLKKNRKESTTSMEMYKYYCKV